MNRIQEQKSDSEYIKNAESVDDELDDSVAQDCPTAAARSRCQFPGENKCQEVLSFALLSMCVCLSVSVCVYVCLLGLAAGEKKCQ